MNSFNDLSEAEDRMRNNKAQVELQERFLSELSQPLNIGGQRARKPLSKFTISANPPVPGERPIPAYRTCAQESLPILSPDDLKRMNISRYTGMSLYDYHSPPSTSSNSTNTRVKEPQLQRKSIHGSLEDLRNTGNHSTLHDHDRISPPPTSSSSRKSYPSADPSSHHMKNENLTRSGKMHTCSGENSSCTAPSQNMESPGYYLQQQHSQIEVHFLANNQISPGISPTDENISTSDDEHCGESVRSGTPRKNLPLNINDQLEQTTGKVKNEHFHKLSLENDSLKKQVGYGKREYIMFRVATELISRSLKRKSLQLMELEQVIQTKRMECAARVVLHHLLLNSWRMTKGQVGTIKLENAQMHKTIDNQSLQLNIIRKMQSMEKEKTSSILKDYAEVKRRYCQVMNENEGIKVEYAKVLEEKSALERHLRSLSDENAKLSTDLRIRVDIREMQLKSLELDRLQTDKFLKENEQLAKEAEMARHQIKELVNQRVQWQEKAMSLESKLFELKLEAEGKGKLYEKVLSEKEEISKQNEILTLSKSNLEKAVEESQTKLMETTAQRSKWESSYNQCRAEVEDLEDQKEYLKTALHQYMKENKEMKEKLKSCSKNAHRRRVWGAALYFILFPFETFKRFYYGTPECYRQPHPHQGHGFQLSIEGSETQRQTQSQSHIPEKPGGRESKA